MTDNTTPTDGQVKTTTDGAWQYKIDSSTGQITVIPVVPNDPDNPTSYTADVAAMAAGTRVAHSQAIEGAATKATPFKVIKMHGDQGDGYYSVEFDADGNQKPGKPQFVGATVGGTNGSVKPVMNVGGVLVAVTEDKTAPGGYKTTPLFTNNDPSKTIAATGAFLRGAGTAASGAAGLIKAPGAAAESWAKANKDLLGTVWGSVEPDIRLVASDPTMTDDQKNNAIQGMINQAVLQSQSGMDAYHRGMIQHYNDTVASQMADTRANIAGGLMRDFSSILPNAVNGTSALAPKAFQALMSGAAGMQSALGGNTIPIGVGSAGVTLGSATPGNANALISMATGLQQKFGMSTSDAVTATMDGLTNGFDSIGDRYKNLPAADAGIQAGVQQGSQAVSDVFGRLGIPAKPGSLPAPTVTPSTSPITTTGITGTADDTSQAY